MTWYLKKNDGSIYGPSVIDTLAIWAREGRVAPDDTVSQDKENWRPAHELPELEMCWEVEIGSGTVYGPVHLLSLRDHVRDNAISADAPLHNLRTGQTGRLDRTLLQATLEHNSSMQADMDALQERLREMENELIELQKKTAVAPEPSPPASSAETQAPAGNRFQLERDVQKWKRMYNDERESGKRREEALSQRIEELRRNESAAQGRIEQLDRRIVQLEKNNATLQDALAGDDRQSHISVQAVTLMSNLETLSANYDRLMAQLAEKSDEVRSVREESAHQEQIAAERIHQVEERLRCEKEESERVRRQLSEMEGTHNNLIHSYRELNDRFIRAFQGKPHPSAAEKESDERTDRTPSHRRRHH